MNFGIVFYVKNSLIEENINFMIQTLKPSDCHFFLENKPENCVFKKHGSAVFLDDLKTIMHLSDIIVVFGGDGSIMHYAKEAAFFNKPICGVNLGSLGFMASLEKSKINQLHEILKNNYRISKRMILEIKIKNSKESFFAINDAVMLRSAESQNIEYEIYKNNNSVCKYSSDGVIVSTPTGSTAYSLSAGGPIVEPSTACMLITPICAHSLTARSLVLNDNSLIKISYLVRKKSQINISIDGNTCFSGCDCGETEIKKSDFTAKFIELPGKNFFSNIDKKLINKMGI